MSAFNEYLNCGLRYESKIMPQVIVKAQYGLKQGVSQSALAVSWIL